MRPARTRSCLVLDVGHFVMGGVAGEQGHGPVDRARMAAKPTMRRSRMPKRQLGIAEPIADAVDGLHVAGPSAVSALNLAAQVGDVHVHGTVETVEIVTENAVDNLVAGEGPARRGGQQGQQAELGWRQGRFWLRRFGRSGS